MELTLEQLFGVNAVQGSQILTINKSDLALLTPSENNTAESLLVAILLKSLENFQGYLKDENGLLLDEYNTPMYFDNSNTFSFLSMILWQEQIINRLNYIYIRQTIVVNEYESMA